MSRRSPDPVSRLGRRAARSYSPITPRAGPNSRGVTVRRQAVVPGARPLAARGTRGPTTTSAWRCAAARITRSARHRVSSRNAQRTSTPTDCPNRRGTRCAPLPRRVCRPAPEASARRCQRRRPSARWLPSCRSRSKRTGRASMRRSPGGGSQGTVDLLVERACHRDLGFLTAAWRAQQATRSPLPRREAGRP